MMDIGQSIHLRIEISNSLTLFQARKMTFSSGRGGVGALTLTIFELQNNIKDLDSRMFS